MAIKSIIDFIETLKNISRNDDFEYYYRGHPDFNFSLLPSIYRIPRNCEINSILKNEDKIFREVILRTPSDFENERTAIEKLVKMQHYGLPTRILDITSNPLIALYFACKIENENDGEVLIFQIPKQEVKFYDSDTVSILSNLSKIQIGFDITEIIEVCRNCTDFDNNDEKLEWFNRHKPIRYLLHQIKDEKPYFLPIIEPEDFNRVLAVRVKLNNNRILKQSGAFFLFGIDNKKTKPAEIPKKWILNKSSNHYDLKVSSDMKGEILKDLDAMAINDSTLFPELENQTEYIKKLYS